MPCWVANLLKVPQTTQSSTSKWSSMLLLTSPALTLESQGLRWIRRGMIFSTVRLRDPFLIAELMAASHEFAHFIRRPRKGQSNIYPVRCWRWLLWRNGCIPRITLSGMDYPKKSSQHSYNLQMSNLLLEIYAPGVSPRLLQGLVR